MAYEEPAEGDRSSIRAIIYCLAIFVISRAILEIIGVGTRALMYPVLDPQYRPAQYSPSDWLDIWGVWDTGWFLSIIERGYDTAVHTGAANLPGQANWPFYPLYPWLSKYLGMLTGLEGFPAMLVIANIAFAAALPLIWHEVRYHYGAKAADIAVAIFAFVPGSYVFSSAYSESLFLLLVVSSLALARRERWLWAGLLAALATLTRNVGVLLAIPIAIYAWQSLGSWRDEHVLSVRRFRVLVAMALPAVALAGYMAFLWRHTGDPLAFMTVQSAWKRELQNPVVTLIGPFLIGGQVQAEIVPSVFMSWASVLLTALLFMRRNWAHAWFMAAVVTITLASGILSYFRLFLTMAPGIMVAGAFFAPRPRAWMVVFGLLAAANGFMMACWSLGLGIY